VDTSEANAIIVHPMFYSNLLKLCVLKCTYILVFFVLKQVVFNVK